MKRFGISIGTLFILILTGPLKVHAGCDIGLEAFKTTVYPIATKKCAQCHGNGGGPAQGPAHSVSDPLQAYNVTSGFINFKNIAQSKFITEGGNGHCKIYDGGADCGATPEELQKAIQAWYDGGENQCALMGKKKTEEIDLTGKAPMNDSTQFGDIKFDLGKVDPSLAGATFEAQIQTFAAQTETTPGAFRIRRPKITTTDKGVRIKGITFIINGKPSTRGTFSSVDTIVAPQSSLSLSPRSEIILNEMMPQNKIAVAFDMIEVSTDSVRCSQPAAYPATLGLFIGNRCVSCHSTEQAAVKAVNMSGKPEDLCNQFKQMVSANVPAGDTLLYKSLSGTSANHRYTIDGEGAEALSSWLFAENTEKMDQSMLPKIPDSLQAAPDNQFFVQMSVGGESACGVTKIGKVHCWGRNEYGQLDGVSTRNYAYPAPAIPLSENAVAVGMGNFNACAILQSGKVQCWGSNTFKLLGYNQDDLPANSIVAPPIQFSKKAVALVVSRHSCALLENGDVHCWGLDDSGQIGSRGVDSVPQKIFSKAVQVAVNNTATCAVLKTGDLKCKGVINNEKIPDNIYVDKKNPAYRVALGSNFVCVLLADRTNFKCWGAIPQGIEGNGANRALMGGNIMPFPSIEIHKGLTVEEISIGNTHMCARLSHTGLVKCWGNNDNGQLGLTDGRNRGALSPANSSFVNLGNLQKVTQIAVGSTMSCALLDNGKIKCWGFSRGGLGNGFTEGGTQPNQMGDSLPFVIFQ